MCQKLCLKLKSKLVAPYRKYGKEGHLRLFPKQQARVLPTEAEDSGAQDDQRTKSLKEIQNGRSLSLGIHLVLLRNVTGLDNLRVQMCVPKY